MRTRVRLANKLTLTLGVGAALVLTTKGLLDVQRERALFDQEAVRVEQLLGRALAATIGEVWRLEGEARALELVKSAHAAEEDLHVRWVWLDANASPEFSPRVDRALLTQVAEGKPVSRKEPGLDTQGLMLRYVPVDYGGARIGALELSKSLASENAYVRSSLTRGVTATIVLIVLFVEMSALFGAWFVTRPVGTLVEQLRRIGAGDLTRKLALTRRDEFAVIATEMNTMTTQLRHADRLTTVGTIAAGIAHELGTPLHVVQSCAKTIAGEPLERAEVVENASLIAEQSRRMIGIIRNLLDFARRRELKREPYDVRHIVDQTISLLHPVIQRRQQKVEVDAPPGELNVNVDLTQLQQALTNLVVNATHAEPAGGHIEVKVSRVRATPPPDVAANDGDYVRIDVRDHGPGFTEEVKEKLFEPFFTTRKVGEGTGLGLPIAAAIVREHDGFIGVETELGRGSCFSIYVPAEAA